LNLNPGSLMEIADYNAIALEINRLFSDTTVDLSWSLSNVVLNYTVSGSNLVSGTAVAFTSAGLDIQESHLIVVTINTGTGWRTLLPTVNYTINYGLNPETITFTTTYNIGTQIKVYYRHSHRYGWGQQASVYPITSGQVVLADEQTLQAYLEANVNNLIDKTNIMETRTGGLSELTRVAPGNLIYATDKSVILSTIATDITSGNNYWRNDQATVLNNIFSFSRTANWTNRLTAAMRWTWPSYNAFRYFFNSGGNIRASLVTTGSPSNQGFANWNQVTTGMGNLTMNYDTTTQTGSGGISNNLGVYELTQDYQKIFTSSSPSLPVDQFGDFDEYGNYTAQVITWWARIVENSPTAGLISIDIQAELDDRAFTQTFAGTIAYQAGYTRANNITDNSATFNSTPFLPTISQQQNFVDNA
jgi:hypothetical protein